MSNSHSEEGESTWPGSRHPATMLDANQVNGNCHALTHAAYSDWFQGDIFPRRGIIHIRHSDEAWIEKDRVPVIR
jgi:hypothetical protein